MIWNSNGRRKSGRHPGRHLPRHLGWLLVAWLARADVVTDWNELMLDAVRASTSPPTLASRNLALLNLALHDAVNSIEGRYQPYQFHLEAAPDLPAEAAAAGAAHFLLPILYPSFRGPAEVLFQSWQANHPADPRTDAALDLGREVARRLLEWRADDGSATQVPYIPSADPGQWRRTPPFHRPPVDPHWRWVRPFALPEIGPFVVPPPPPLDSPEYARALNEVRLLGARQSTIRTEHEGRIAVFWSDFSYTATPPGHWHQIALTIARDRQMPLGEAVRMMALLGLAQADTAIVCWEGKYRFNLWRPITAIHRAGEDNNPETLTDGTWDSWLITPSFPEYPSGHSSFSGAAATLLGAVCGTDAVTFTATSDSMPGVHWTYDSLWDCAEEIGRSRIHGGIHFEFANREGKRSGARIAAHVAGNWLLPLEPLPFARLEGWRDGRPAVRVQARPGTRFQLEASSDLKHWVSIAEEAFLPGGVRIVDHRGDHALPQAFYRVRELDP